MLKGGCLCNKNYSFSVWKMLKNGGINIMIMPTDPTQETLKLILKIIKYIGKLKF